jgi:anthranilate phosphoribosyltransferase
MLSKKQIEKFLGDSVAGKLSSAQQVNFLKEFSIDRVTPENLKIFVDFMQKHMTARLDMPKAVDVCGTGGSGLNRINTSTIAAFILSELGVKIAKHGNKAASGRFGSFDLLESLGVDIGKSPAELKKSYKKTGLVFIFARNFHPAMKFFAEARILFGKPTIFNILGPLLNPANPKIQIIGTSFLPQMELIAETCKILKKKKVLVVRGFDGLDEVTLTGRTDIIELNNGKITKYTVGPEDFGIKPCKFEGIQGGDMVSAEGGRSLASSAFGGVGEKNKQIALDILKGACASRHADLVYINCALALKFLGKVNDLKEGYRLAKNACGLKKLADYKNDILLKISADKFLKRSDRDFYNALKKYKNTRPSLIAEIKRASPTKGIFLKGKLFSPKKIAKIYEENGANAISVVTDNKYFKGSFEYLKAVKSATKNIPVLCKDFFIHEYQIYKAREYGADAILLIASILSKEQIISFVGTAKILGMECLVEVRNEEDLKKVLETPAKIIGVNNRNLTDFSIDLETTNKLAKLIPKDKILVSESGISSKKDLKKLTSRVDAVLIGTAFMQSKNIKQLMHEFT